MGRIGYCASHCRYFRGLRLHLVCALHGLPVGYALPGAKADERQTFWTSSPAPRPWPESAPTGTARSSSATRTTTVPASKKPSTRPGSICSARPAREKNRGQDPGSSSPAADHRIDQRHPQGPAGPRTPRRTHPRGRHRPDHPAPAGHDRGHLAQRPDRTGRPPLTGRLRPLTSLGVHPGSQCQLTPGQRWTLLRGTPRLSTTKPGLPALGQPSHPGRKGTDPNPVRGDGTCPT